MMLVTIGLLTVPSVVVTVLDREAENSVVPCRLILLFEMLLGHSNLSGSMVRLGLVYVSRVRHIARGSCGVLDLWTAATLRPFAIGHMAALSTLIRGMLLTLLTAPNAGFGEMIRKGIGSSVVSVSRITMMTFEI